MTSQEQRRSDPTRQGVGLRLKAAQFDALSEKQRTTFRALWLAYVQTALDDNGVETRMPITKTEKEPRP